MDEKRSKKRRHLCLAKLGVARGARGADPVDEGFWRLNKHVITDCLQLATLYLPTKVTVHPLPAARWIRHPLPDAGSADSGATKRERERAEPANRGPQARLRGTPSSRCAGDRVSGRTRRTERWDTFDLVIVCLLEIGRRDAGVDNQDKLRKGGWIVRSLVRNEKLFMVLSWKWGESEEQRRRSIKKISLCN